MRPQHVGLLLQLLTGYGSWVSSGLCQGLTGGLASAWREPPVRSRPQFPWSIRRHRHHVVSREPQDNRFYLFS